MADTNDRTPNNSKLTNSKRRWAEERKFLTGRHTRSEQERLPPGQHLVTDWPVLDLGRQPDVEKEDWKLKIFGAVDTPFTWDWAAYSAQPQSRFVSDIHCVTTWSRYDNRWDGVSTRDLIALAKPQPDARHCQINLLRVQTRPALGFQAAMVAATQQHSRCCETGEESIEKSGDVGR